MHFSNPVSERRWASGSSSQRRGLQPRGLQQLRQVRLHQMVRILALSVLVLAPLTSAAQDQSNYCAFEIAVSSPAGSPIAGVGVSLQRRGGQVYSTTTTSERGIASICDAPDGLVDIEVGGHLCGAVAVRYLKQYWMKTRRVSITYENCSGEEWVPLGGCLRTIRVVDEHGALLKGVLFDQPDKRSRSREQTWVSDQFGRIFRFVNYGETLTGSLEKAGYVSKSVTDECNRAEPSEKELLITLNRRR